MKATSLSAAVSRRTFVLGTAAASGTFFIPSTRLFGQELPKKQLLQRKSRRHNRR